MVKFLMANSKLVSKLNNLPQKPGVYLFKNAGGGVLYVGKAKVLKNRIKSYFGTLANQSPKTIQLVSSIADLEYIICDTEVESLILENHLIKKYRPRYNILLRDDKNYQFIKIDYSTEIPQIYTVRKIETGPMVRPLPALPWPGEGKGKRKIHPIYTAGKIVERSPSPIPSPQPRQHSPGQGRGRALRLPTANYPLPANKYFGPYTSGAAVRSTLSLLRYIFPYCANKKIGPRPCFYYHLGRCPGVCAGVVTLEQYRQSLVSIERFLRGDFQYLLASLKTQMKEAAAKKLYERAGRVRDQIRALEKTLQQQKIVSAKREAFDTVSVFQAGDLAAANLFQVREGKLGGKLNFILENAKNSSPEELLISFFEKYYLESSDVPTEVITESPVRLSLGFLQAVSQRTGKKIRFTSPSRGRKRQLVGLGATNARDFLDQASRQLAKEQAMLTRAVFELQNKFKLSRLPLRIECFDVSNIQGTEPVGSMVVFENGRPKKTDYRRFAVKTLDTPNDVGMLQEILTRRLAHSSLTRPAATLSRDGRGAGGGGWRLPDLIVIDGGRGQLNAALKVMRTARIKLPVASLAKRLEEIYLPQIKSPLRLPPDSPGLHLLQRIRDEAHRFAVTYHRKKRSKRMLAAD
ncbi:MAG: excinuclease ABC subunit UvrC [Candidatus Doudnabacteria bacterium]|nr:excinuclease ABC subunit UvrC [Candidatus Doudnabacteria bacterium]